MENLIFITKLGRGTHGSVYLFEDNNSELIACKSISKKYTKQATTEISILKKLSHTNIIKFISNSRNDLSQLVFMEFANYGSIETLIKYFKEHKMKAKNWMVWSLIAQISSALSYLHSKNIIHRDVKPSNILMHKNFYGNVEIIEFKICDFSLAVESEKNVALKAKSFVGTPYYMAPEIINKSEYNEKIDVWGLGVCLYELLSLEKPFNGKGTTELGKEILKKEIKNVVNCNDKKLKEIILWCLKKFDRPSSHFLCNIPEIRRIMEKYENIIGENCSLDWPPTPGK